eukprot:TRINITY_DN9027_c0_g1_i1.p2 TRINITY_DN9027_c0_g1~~TRINITY_DN9027_c0_g1_i1.p2  ORF type:complete len:167 (-),score=13.79 TRINITY_DN9027_c0_g1_i1:300-800(-)
MGQAAKAHHVPCQAVCAFRATSGPDMSQGNPRLWNYFNLEDCFKSSLSIPLHSLTPLPQRALAPCDDDNDIVSLPFSVPGRGHTRRVLDKPVKQEVSPVSDYVQDQYRHTLNQLHALSQRQLLGVDAACELLSQPRFQRLRVLAIPQHIIYPWFHTCRMQRKYHSR